MHDQPLLVLTLSRFVAILPERYDLENTLTELTESVTAVLGAFGSAVSMANDGWLRYATRAIQASGELERNHKQLQPCPCRDAFDTGEAVRVTDLREESARWPEFSASAARLSLASVAVVPMRLASQIIGTLNLYSTEPRKWSDRDIAVAGVLANMATGNVVNASKLGQQEQLSEQLREALVSQAVIEQASRITANRHSVTAEQAYQLMRWHARNNNASLRIVAEGIVAGKLHV